MAVSDALRRAGSALGGRDRFILSKGHAAAATSFSQAAIGCYDKEDIYKEYGADFGRFAMHSCNLRNPYVDVSTGSLAWDFRSRRVWRRVCASRATIPAASTL